MKTMDITSKVDIIDEFDVIVIGGGISGVAAAIASGRSGSRTLLIEKSVMLGGLATLGHVVIYLPLCDGKGRKIIGGISEELLHLSLKYGYGSLSESWLNGKAGSENGDRYQTVFNAPSFTLALDEVIENAKVEILFDTVFSVPVIDQGYCKAVIVENKSGRQGYTGKMIIDATGDSDVMFRAGAQCVEADNWLAYWGYYSDLESMKEAVASANIMKAIKLLAYGGDRGGKGVPDGLKKFSGTNAKNVTEFVLQGRKLARELIAHKDKNEYSLLALPGMPQFRTTRRIKGCYELTGQDVFMHFDDSIGCTGDWRKEGPVYEIPFKSLISKEIKNIITCGRTIASGGDAWEVTRVIPAAALTGQAAGTAAALAAKSNSSIQEIQVGELQSLLSASGVLIHH